MTLRAGMTALINQVRAMADAGGAEWTLNTGTQDRVFWSDDEIQAVLDRHKTQYVHSQLEGVLSYEGGHGVYKLFRLGDTDIESGTGFALTDVNGAAVSGFVVDYTRGIVTFSADQIGRVLYWDGFSYDLNGAAAEIWREKASHAAQLVDWSSDNHSVKKSQLSAAYLHMAETFGARSKVEGVRTIKIVRDDL